MGVDSPLPSAGQETLLHRGFGTDAKVSSHEVKKNGVDTKLSQQVRVTVEQLTALDGSERERERERERGGEREREREREKEREERRGERGERMCIECMCTHVCVCVCVL